MSKRRKISGQFVPRRLEMLRSPAFCALSLSGHRILARIEIEHANHGGKDNGKLPVTFADFAEDAASINRTRSRPPSARPCALGFIEVTRRGRAGNGEYRTPNLFRLTYLPTTAARRPTNGAPSKPSSKPNRSPARPAKSLGRKIQCHCRKTTAAPLSESAPTPLPENTPNPQITTA